MLAAGLIGAVSGLSLKDDVQSASASAEPAVTVAVPAAKQEASGAIPSAPVRTTDAALQQPVGAYAYAPRSRHRVSRQRLSSWAQQQAQESQLGQNVAAEPQPAEIASNDLATDPLAPKPVEASMPLPNKVIARTIERIGYSCGEVSSTSAVDGSSGAYNVTTQLGADLPGDAGSRTLSLPPLGQPIRRVFCRRARGYDRPMARADQREIRMRIVIENPVPGVLHSLQSKDGHPLDSKKSDTGEALAFDFPVRIAEGPKFFGDQVRREGPCGASSISASASPPATAPRHGRGG